MSAQPDTAAIEARLMRLREQFAARAATACRQTCKQYGVNRSTGQVMRVYQPQATLRETVRLSTLLS